MRNRQSTKSRVSVLHLVLAMIFTLSLFDAAFAPKAMAAVGDKVYSRAYSTGGSGNALAAIEHTVSFEIT